MSIKQESGPARDSATIRNKTYAWNIPPSMTKSEMLECHGEKNEEKKRRKVFPIFMTSQHAHV